MRSAAMLALAWLLLMLFFTDLQASAQVSGCPTSASLIPDSLITITLPQSSTSCSPAAKKTYSVRFHSLKAAGGTLYERKLTSQSVLKYIQSLGAKNVTANVFSICANAAEKQKMNVFRYDGGVCTLYTVLPAASLLSLYGSVGAVVVYMVLTSLNNAASPSVPQINVVNFTVDPKNRMISAIWNLLDPFSFTEQINVTVNNVTNIISLSNTSLTTTGSMNVSQGTFELLPAGMINSKTTFKLRVTSPELCTKYFVFVTPLNADGRAIGATVTGNVTTWPSLSNVINCTIDTVTLDNFTISWNFPDCGQTGYTIDHDDIGVRTDLYVSKSTSLTLLGIEVCNKYKSIYVVNALDLNNNTMLSTSTIQMPLVYYKTSNSLSISDWKHLNACSMNKYQFTSNFSTAKKICNDVLKGDLFKYGGETFSFGTNVTTMYAWVDLQYSASSGTWIWGNGMVEPNNSANWDSSRDPTKGTCAFAIGRKLTVEDCTAKRESECFKIY